jgi:hypothetical protein
MGEIIFKTYSLGEIVDNLGENEIAIKIDGTSVGDRIYKNNETCQLRRVNIDSCMDIPLMINTIEVLEKSVWIILKEES